MDNKTREKLLLIADMVLSAGDSGHDLTFGIDFVNGEPLAHLSDYGKNWDGKTDALKRIQHYSYDTELDSMIDYLETLRNIKA